MTRQSFSGKLALAAAAGPAALAGTAAHAALVTVATPLSISFTDLPAPAQLNRPELDSVSWDVDGDGNADFVLQAERSIFQSPSGIIWGTSNGNRISKYRHFLNSGGFLSRSTLNGIGFFRQPAGISPAIPFSATPTTGPYSLVQGVYLSRSFRLTSINIPYTSYNYYSEIGIGNGFSAGDNNIAFAFQTGGNTHYGWAIVNLTDGPDFRPTIEQWTYETDPDTPVHVGSVPVPAMLAPSLALLAVGAAGVRRWRQTKASQQREAAT